MVKLDVMNSMIPRKGKTSNTNSLYLVFLLLLSGDVELNPGPASQSTLTIKDLKEVLDDLRKGGFSDESYYDLGLDLGLHHSTLNIIRSKNPVSAKARLIVCIEKWLKRVDDVDKVGRTNWTTLCIAVEKINRATADYIRMQHPIQQQDVSKWLEEGTVNLTVKRVQMLGPPGSGKTCAQHLLLNEDRPKEDSSTPIACRAVKATRISVDNGCMEIVDAKALLSRLACDLQEAVAKQGELMGKGSTSSKKESSEMNPRPPDKNDPHANEIRNKIVKAIPKAKANLNCRWVYIIDSGGQTAFQELLPLFTRASSLNIITLDLSKGMDKKLVLKYRIKGKEFTCDPEFSYTNAEFLKDVLSSGSIVNPDIHGDTQESKKEIATYPSYLVLGTHSDKVKPREIEKCNKVLSPLISESKEKGYCIIPGKQGKIIYPVNTMLESGSLRQDESKKLCSTIFDFYEDTSDVTFDMFPLPVRWFAFELTLLEKAGKRSFLDINEVLSAGANLQMKREDTEEALKHLHNVSLVLYYPEVLEDVVFVDPHPILDTLSRLLALTYEIDGDFLHLLARPAPFDFERNALKERGMFFEELLDKLKDDEQFPKANFIKLMLHLHIIVETQDGYFIPSALRSCDRELPESPTHIINPLLIVWLSPLREILPVPRGIFPLAVANLMNYKKMKFRLPPPSCQQYRDALTFFVDDVRNKTQAGTIHFIKKHKQIEVYFKGKDKEASQCCPLICKAVKEAISSSSVAINLKPSHELAFACPSTTSNCYCIITDEDNKTVQCTSPACNEQAITSCQKEYWNWFHDCKGKWHKLKMAYAFGLFVLFVLAECLAFYCFSIQGVAICGLVLLFAFVGYLVFIWKSIQGVAIYGLVILAVSVGYLVFIWKSVQELLIYVLALLVLTLLVLAEIFSIWKSIARITTFGAFIVVVILWIMTWINGGDSTIFQPVFLAVVTAIIPIVIKNLFDSDK